MNALTRSVYAIRRNRFLTNSLLPVLDGSMFRNLLRLFLIEVVCAFEALRVRFARKKRGALRKSASRRPLAPGMMPFPSAEDPFATEDAPARKAMHKRVIVDEEEVTLMEDLNVPEPKTSVVVLSP